MTTQTKIIIGISVVIVAAGLFVWPGFITQIHKSGEGSWAIKYHKNEREKLQSYIAFLEDSLADAQAQTILDSIALNQALADYAASIDRENIFKKKIEMDSLILNEVKERNAKNDSLSKFYTADEWDCYITKQISCEGCN